LITITIIENSTVLSEEEIKKLKRSFVCIEKDNLEGVS